MRRRLHHVPTCAVPAHIWPCWLMLLVRRTD